MKRCSLQKEQVNLHQNVLCDQPQIFKNIFFCRICRMVELGVGQMYLINSYILELSLSNSFWLFIFFLANIGSFLRIL